MSSNEKPTTRATLGLGGLTMNAMALIAPGAFLWLTFFIQSSYGAPMAAQGMWFGIFAALLLCLATAIAYAELSKLYPGAGSSYFFAEQAFLSKTKAYKFARIAKFMVGWASHLYYWVYPGLMVGVTALVVGYMVGQIWPDTFNAAIPSPLFMIIFCPLFAFGVAYICFRGVTGTTAVNTAINVIQITALVVFSVIAVGYRLNHPQGSVGITLDPNGSPITKVIATDKDGKPVKDAQGNFVIAKGSGRQRTGFHRRLFDAASEGPLAGRSESDGRHIPVSRYCRVGCGATQFQLHVHPGLYRDFDSGRLRVRHVDGRRSQECESAIFRRPSSSRC